MYVALGTSPQGGVLDTSKRPPPTLAAFCRVRGRGPLATAQLHVLAWLLAPVFEPVVFRWRSGQTCLMVMLLQEPKPCILPVVQEVARPCFKSIHVDVTGGREVQGLKASMEGAAVGHRGERPGSGSDPS